MSNKQTTAEYLEPRFREVFDCYDTDGSKTIDKDEMKDFARNIAKVRKILKMR
jgi:Ca2+-binding EF-hand superfamily protein